MSAPFRFGIHLWELPLLDWPKRVRGYESLGFSTVTFTDHLVVPQWEPMTAVTAVAAVTDRIRVGTLVLDAGLRDPVLTAKAAATVERLSGGRLELGLGAGYVAANFAAAGLPFESGADRVDRLEEMVTLVGQLWTQPTTSFRGRFFEVAESPMVGPEPVQPRLLIGGGGRRVMHLGGRVADTVSMIPRQTTGTWSLADSVRDSTQTRMAEKAAGVRQGARDAGRDPDTVELNTMVAKVIVGSDPGPRISQEASDSGITPAQMADSTLYLCGTGVEVCDRLQRWRQEIGISYFSLFDPGDEQVEYFAEQVGAKLGGQ